MLDPVLTCCKSLGGIKVLGSTKARAEAEKVGGKELPAAGDQRSALTPETQRAAGRGGERPRRSPAERWTELLLLPWFWSKSAGSAGEHCRGWAPVRPALCRDQERHRDWDRDHSHRQPRRTQPCEVLRWRRPSTCSRSNKQRSMFWVSL